MNGQAWWIERGGSPLVTGAIHTQVDAIQVAPASAKQRVLEALRRLQ